MPEIKSINNIPICDVTARENIEDIEKNYATKLDLETRAPKSHEHPQYLTEHQNLSGYATKDYVNEVVQNVQGGGSIDLSLYATKLDLNNYVTRTELNGKGYLTMVPSEYITEAELVAKKYATKEYVLELITSLDLSGGSEGGFNIDLSEYALKTDIPSLEEYALKTDIPSLSGYVKTTDLEDYYTKSAVNILVNNRVLSTEFSSFKGSVSSTIDTLREKIEELEAEIEALKNANEQVPPEEPEPEEPTNRPCTNITLSDHTLTFEALNTSITLTTTVTPSNTTDTITWRSSKENIATVVNGKVTAIAEGNCVITATCGSKSASCTVTVEVEEPETTVPCTNISLDKTNLTFTAIDDFENLTATVTPANTTDIIVWESDNEDIAIVYNGSVTAKGSGECIITATCGNQDATCNVTVNLVEEGDE